MRISFDLDDTLICYGGDVPCEPRLSWLLRLFIHDEPLRRGTTQLARDLHSRGHELWIYTTSYRRPFAVKCWMRAHGIRVARVVNQSEHMKRFGHGAAPSKNPAAFGIDVHVDDSPGVAIEGERHGFQVVVVDRSSADWVGRILHAVDEHSESATEVKRNEEGNGNVRPSRA